MSNLALVWQPSNEKWEKKGQKCSYRKREAFAEAGMGGNGG